MSQIQTEYDYIIVGAGSSGCVLADRLSADGKSSVLLVEAGGRNESELVNMPRAFMKMFGRSQYFWFFPVEKQERRPPGEVWYYGKGLGGSSSALGATLACPNGHGPRSNAAISRWKAIDTDAQTNHAERAVLYRSPSPRTDQRSSRRSSRPGRSWACRSWKT